MKATNLRLRNVVKHSLVVVTIMWGLSACGISKFKAHIEDSITTETQDRIYTQAEIAEDIDFYLKTVHEVCPAPYMASDSNTIAQLASDIKKKGDRNGKALYLDFLRLSASFNVGHMYAIPPKQMLNNFFARGGKVLPFALLKKDDMWFVSHVDNADQSLREQQVTSINGLEIDSLIYSFDPYLSIENREEIIGRELAFYLWLKEVKAPYQVDFRDTKTQEKFTKRLEGYGKAVEASNNRQVGEDKLSDYIKFKLLPNNIAYINSKSMGIFDKKMTKQFSDFTKNTFAKIKAQKCQHLIIDLRENSGGRGQFAEELLDYFANKPYRQSAGGIRRVSPQYKGLIKQMPWIVRKISLKKGGMQNYLSLPNGQNIVDISETEQELPELPTLKNRFEGKVWCLIGSGTYSAAMMMANAIEDYDLGTLIGEPTGGIPNELSDALPIKTPNTKVSFTVPSVMFTRANGDPTNSNPVLPDVEIKTSWDDIKKGKDPVMDYVLKQISVYP